MKANASPSFRRKIDSAPYITFELPQPDEHEGTYVTPKFEIRYDVREFVVDRREVYDVEILEVELESAVAWIGDCGVNVPCGDTNFEVSAFALWQRWYDYYSTACRCWPNRELIDAKIIHHYVKNKD